MTVQGHSRRQFLGRAGLLLGAVAAGPLLAACNSEAARAGAAGGAATGGGAGARTALSMQLGWLLDNGQLGEAVALSKGWYADNGITFSVAPGGPNVDGVALVAGGQHAVGEISSSPSLMVARSQGIPIKAFAVAVQEHPYGYFSLPGKEVHEPQDLVGKKVGIQATGQVLLSALLAANDIDPGDVEVVVVGSDVTPLTTGQVDVWTGWVSNVAALRPLGGKYTVMRLWDAGIQLYANPYYATEATLSSQGETLQKFVSASAEGWKYARENLDEAVAALTEMEPTLTAEDMKAQGEVLLDFIFTDASEKNGWGAMDRAVWQQQIDQWDALDQFKGGKPALEDVAHFDILEATADARTGVS